MSRRKKRQRDARSQEANEVSNRKPKTPSTSSPISNMTSWFILLLIVLPVLFSRTAIDPVIGIRFLCLGFFLLFFILRFRFKKNSLSLSLSPLVKAVFVCAIAFALWSSISLFISVNPGAGYYEAARNFLNIVLLYAITVMVKNEESGILKICKTLVIVSLIQSVVGIFQFYDIAFTEIPGNFTPYGLMANRNLFGSAQCFLLPFVVFALYKGSKSWKFISTAAFAGIIISLLISQTRSAWIAALVMMLVAFILAMVFMPSERKKWALGYVSGVIGVLVIVFLVIKTGGDETLKQSVQQRAISITQPLAETDTESGDNIHDRLEIWKRTLRVIRENPVTGVGPSNWKLRVLEYGSEGMSWAEGFYVPDRPHNVYLHTLSENGIPGAILYFGMWILIVVLGFRNMMQSDSPERRVLNILMVAGLAAFASDNMFSFANERIEHTLYISLMAGIILGTSTLDQSNKQIKIFSPGNGWFFITVFFITLNLLIGFKKQSFEKHANLSKAYLDAGNYNQSIAASKSAKNFWVTVDPEGIPVEVYSSVAYKNMKDFDNALKEGLLAKKYNPNSMMTLNNLGTIYTETNQFDNAIALYEQARTLTPKSGVVLKNLAFNYYRTGNFKGCTEILESIPIDDDPFLQNLLKDAKNRILPAP